MASRRSSTVRPLLVAALSDRCCYSLRDLHIQFLLRGGTALPWLQDERAVLLGVLSAAGLMDDTAESLTVKDGSDGR
jgi:hypothetical protein